MGGGLEKYQNTTATTSPANPFIFSTPSATKGNRHARTQSTAPKNLLASFNQAAGGHIRTKSKEMTSMNGNKRGNLFKTTYGELTKHTHAPRPVSAMPNKKVVSFARQPT